ncbi:hypothetical protein ACWDBC_35690, partial [Streptomyces parvus]
APGLRLGRLGGAPRLPYVHARHPGPVPFRRGLGETVARRDGVVMTVASFDIADGRVTRIWAVRNPEKLRPWARHDADTR